ncbi:MAG: prolyl oligopeptidase family serine peptidase [Myxococcaceae bacterium]
MNHLPLAVMLSCLACSTPQLKPVVTPLGASSPSELEKQATALVDAFRDEQAVFTHDGKRVVFVSSRDGLPQLYVKTLGSGAVPRRLAVWPDAMGGPIITPDDQHVIFSADSNGNEQVRFYSVALSGGPVRALTPDPLNRDWAFLPEGASDRIFFSARQMSSPRSEIYSVGLRGDEPARLLYRDDGAGFLYDVTSDGQHALFGKIRTHQDNPLFVVGLKTGTARRLYPAQGAATIRTATFSRDGKRAYVVTDGGGEQALVLSLDVETGAELGRYEESQFPGAVGESLVLDRTGRTLAVGFDAGNRQELRLLDAATLRLRARVDLPLGRGQLSAFSDDGKTLTVTWSTPSNPSSIFTVSSTTGTATPLVTFPRTGLPAVDVDVSQTSVKAFDGLELPVNVYRPRGGGRHPVILSLHGGPAGASAIGWGATRQLFLSKGYAWVEPNIRGSAGFGRTFEAADDGRKRSDSFRDIDSVRSWLVAQPWTDPTRLVVYGSSYGGFLVLHQLATQPGAWRAGVDLFGIADLKTFMASTKGLVLENYRHELGDPTTDAVFLESLSPLKKVDAIVAPLFVYSGANDPRVPRAQADAIVSALKARKVPVEYMLAMDEGHGIARRENLIAFQVRLALFLERTLNDKKGTAP